MQFLQRQEMRIVNVATDNREENRNYHEFTPSFAAGHEALLQGFARMPEIEFHAVSCTQQRMNSPERLAENIWFHSIHVPKIGWLRTFYQGCIRGVRRKVRELKPDLVHGHGTERNCGLCAAMCGYPNVISMHGSMIAQERLTKPCPGTFFWLASWLEKFALRRTQGVISNSRYMEELVQPLARKSWLVPHALRLAFFDPPPPIDPRPCVLLNAGVISARKRQCELLDVAGQLHSKGLSFELRFIGPAPKGDAYARKFLDRIRPMQAAGYARYLGRLPEGELVRSYDAASGMIHFPSEESFGNVVVESLARNLKFFGSRLGGILDIVEGVPGIELFDYDDWTGLTGAVAKWIVEGHPRLDQAAAVMRNRYHPESIAHRYVEIYHQLLAVPWRPKS